MDIVNLRCEWTQNPLGIDTRFPQFSWELKSDARDCMQQSYRIIVFEHSDRPDVQEAWDSGAVKTEKNYGATYAGIPLKDATRYNWQVFVTLDNGETAVSAPAWFETGLPASEWGADWIEPDRPLTKVERTELIHFGGNPAPDKKPRPSFETDVTNMQPPIYFRKAFFLPDGVHNARLYATAHGIYRAEVNGKRVGQAEFAPDFTPYSSILQYQTYDITEYLQPGENVVGFLVADGWYCGKIAMSGDNCQYGRQIGLLFSLRAELNDGTSIVVNSAQDVRFSIGPYCYADICVGEKYDARRELPGWSTAKYDDQAWKLAVVRPITCSNIVAQSAPLPTVVDELPAQSVAQCPDGSLLIDFGQVICGYVSFFVQGPAGTTVTIEHSEMLQRDGTFFKTLQGKNKDQKDIYILSGAPKGERYCPAFTSHGFRYARIVDYPGEAKKSNFFAKVVSSKLERTGFFECSSEKINKLMENIWWGQIGNMLSIPTDCPQRERAGWTGDIAVYAPTAVWNQDLEQFLRRWLRLLRAEQKNTGEVTMTAPYLPSLHQSHQNSFHSDTSAGWGDACVIVPWVLYREYGNLEVLRENFDMMERWIRYVQKEAKEHIPSRLQNAALTEEEMERHRCLWNTGFHFGDHCSPSAEIPNESSNPEVRKSLEMIPALYYVYTTQLMEEISQALGLPEKANAYAELHQRVKSAFIETYTSADGLYAKTQGTYILALAFHAVPEELRPKLAADLDDMIHANGDCHDAGFLSLPFLMDMLTENGYAETAYTLLFQEKCPSWLYEVNHGATTIWENWKCYDENGQVRKGSYNHYAFGCVGDWIYRTIGGVKSLDTAYRRIQIAPNIKTQITWASVTHHTMNGDIQVSWRVFEDSFALEIQIPIGTKAEIILPASTPEKAWEQGIPILDAFQTLRQEDDGLHICTGAGAFRFLCTF